jgi:hypothetical protein
MTVPAQAPAPGSPAAPAGPRLGRTQRWLIGGAIAAVLWLGAVALCVAGIVLLVAHGTRPGLGSEPDPWSGFRFAQALFVAGSILFQLGTGAIVITTILAMQAPPRGGSGHPAAPAGSRNPF